jgi:hypothetical protein
MGSLHKWFKSSKSVDGKPGWVEVISGEPCAREEGEEGTPKCVSSDKRASMTKKERISAQRRKSAADPNQPEKSGAAKPTYVSTDKPEKKMNEEKDKPGKGSGKKDACYTKVKSRYDVWPSAYASGALTKCRKVGAANWGNKTEEMGMIRYCPKCGKDETRSECRYGEKYWDMFSIPSALTSNQLKYDIAQVHPANEEKQPDHEHSMARSELSTIVSAAKRLRKKLKGEGNIEAWVQSKITKAADYIDAAADYIDSGEHDVHGSMDENVSFEIGHTSADTRKAIRQDKLIKRAESGQQGADVARKKLTGIQLPLANSTDLKTFGDFIVEASAAWQRKEGKNPEGGLNKKGIASYRRENPGSKLSLAVTTPPSKLKPGSKKAKRRKSFCARMSGMPGPMKDEKGRPTRKALSLRKWNC